MHILPTPKQVRAPTASVFLVRALHTWCDMLYWNHVFVALGVVTVMAMVAYSGGRVLSTAVRELGRGRASCS